MSILKNIVQKVTEAFSENAKGKNQVNALPSILAGSMNRFKEELVSSDEYVAGINPLETLIDSLYETNPSMKDAQRMAMASDLVTRMANENPTYQIYIDDAKDISRIGQEKLDNLKMQRFVKADVLDW